MTDLRIHDTFAITGRGTVVVTNKTPELHRTAPLQATLRLTDGTLKSYPAYPEMIARRSPASLNKDAFLLVGAEKEMLPIGGIITLMGA